MARTAQLNLPLVLPAQAQKHVTVNEAFARLDAVAQLRVLSSTTTTPPAVAPEGTSYLVPEGATDAWQGRVDHIAVWSNGGWIFIQPRAGWRAWDESRHGHSTFDGSGWIDEATAITVNGAGTRQRVIEFDHPVASGPNNTTSVGIPDRAQVIGVTGRVVATVTGGGLASWRLGVFGSDNRYGSGLGLAQNSYIIGLSGSPVTYFAETPLLLSAEGGNFAGGMIRFALHIVEITPPRAV